RPRPRSSAAKRGDRLVRTRWILTMALAVAGAIVAAPGARAADDITARLVRAREVYRELIQSPDREIPQTLEDQCKCVAVFPHVVKAAFGIGGRYGKG